MRELDEMALNDLIEVYELYVKEGLSPLVVKKAEQTYNEYLPGQSMLNKTILSAVCSLFAVSYPTVKSGISVPTKEEAKQILEKLKMLQKEIKEQK